MCIMSKSILKIIIRQLTTITYERLFLLKEKYHSTVDNMVDDIKYGLSALYCLSVVRADMIHLL